MCFECGEFVFGSDEFLTCDVTSLAQSFSSDLLCDVKGSFGSGDENVVDDYVECCI